MWDRRKNVSAMKHWNRWLLLGLVALGVMAPEAKAQNLVSTRIGLSDQYAQFLVDGQVFSGIQVFVWPEGSSHVVQFPYSQDPSGGGAVYQYMERGQARFQFGGWLATSTVPMVLGSSPVVSIVASSQLTEVMGTVVKQIPLQLVFEDRYDTPACEPIQSGGDPGRPGVLLIDNTCYSGDTIAWITPDAPHSFQVVAYPGYSFQQAYVGDYIQNLPGAFSLTFSNGSVFRPLFVAAKRVRFSTTPVGLQVLVDGSPVTPKGLAGQRFDSTPVSSSDCGEFQALPVTAPQGIQPLCIGDFDFVPGSVHTIGAPTPQTDVYQQVWVFDHFSNGLGQNSVYNAPTTTDTRDDITAVFTLGIKGVVQANVTGLKVIVDGNSNWPEPFYGVWWGAGQVHHIEAPETQRDANGRLWKFTGWSDGGDRVHDVSAPAGVDHVIITANYVELGQINVTSTVQGLTIKANGKDCATPCVLDDAAGATLTIEAPANVALGEGSRYQFDSWLGKSNTTQLQLTFTQDAVSYKAAYHASHRLLASSDPDGGATFKFTPDSSDGFFAEGTKVQITVQPKTGYKFQAWSGDLNSTSKDEYLTMVGPSSVVAHLEKVPAISPAGIRNAAGGGPDGTVAPGSIIAIYGENLTSQLQIGPSNPLAQAIGNVYVTVGQSILPLIIVSPTQINAQLLSTLGEGDYTLTVHATGQQDVTGKFTVKKNAPGVFYNVTSDGMPLVAALHQDGTPVTEDSPAQRGETITFYGTGLSALAQPWIDGFILPSDTVFTLVDPVKVMAGIPAPPPVDGQDAPAPAPLVVRDPVFAAGAPGMVGTSVVKFKVDNDLPAGNVLELYLSVNGSVSNRVQLPVK